MSTPTHPLEDVSTDAPEKMRLIDRIDHFAPLGLKIVSYALAAILGALLYRAVCISVGECHLLYPAKVAKPSNVTSNVIGGQVVPAGTIAAPVSVVTSDKGTMVVKSPCIFSLPVAFMSAKMVACAGHAKAQ